MGGLEILKKRAPLQGSREERCCGRPWNGGPGGAGTTGKILGVAAAFWAGKF